MENYQKVELMSRAGRRIAKARKCSGFSQERLLDEIYLETDVLIDRNTLSLIERGRIATSGYNLFIICSALGLKIDELFI
jgi:transcriptional regulator with XRE-family HTH domain